MRSFARVMFLVTCFPLLDNPAVPQDTRGEHPPRQEVQPHPVGQKPASPPGSLVVLDSIPPAAIPVLSNALGDINQDSLVDLRDLLRLRDIVIGWPPAPTPYEMNEGDMDQSGHLDTVDLRIARSALLGGAGVPHVIGFTGGSVAGAGITMSFDSGQVPNNTVMRIDMQTAADIETFSGVDFHSLLPESTYFMTGFRIESSNRDFIFPPRMDIRLDQLPPCQLSGSNLLMTARRGPTGEAELVMLSALGVSVDSNLVVPPPPYPNIGLSPASGNGPSSTLGRYEPGQPIYLTASNLSRNLSANVVYFSQSSGSRYPVMPLSFTPVDYTSLDDINGIIVITPPLPPGVFNLGIEHEGTKLISNEIQVEILSLHIPGTSGDSVMMRTFARIDTFLTEFASWAVLDSYPMSLLEADRQKFALVRYYSRQVLDSLLALPPGTKQGYASYIENTKADSILSKAIDRIRGANQQATRENPPFANQGLMPSHVLVTGPGVVMAGAGVVASVLGVACAVAGPVTLGSTCFLWGFVALSASLHSLAWEVFQPPSSALYESQRGQYLHNKRLPHVGIHSSATVLSDPSFEPSDYPGFCMNIWKHNTNAMGSLGGGCSAGCCASGGSGCPPNSLNGGILADGMRTASRFTSVWPGWYSFIESPLKGAIVRPNNGGIQGIVGIVDGAGSFAIPGLHPGDSVAFSVYDPHTGLFDPDAGYGFAPDVAEQGVFFPVFLYFDPDTTRAFYGLAFGEVAQDSIRLGRATIEYLLNVRQEHLGRPFNIGFRSTSLLSVRVEDPEGALLIHEPSTSCYFDELTFSRPGIHKIRAGFGVTGDPGTFSLALMDSPIPQFPIRLCGPIRLDSLQRRFSPYMTTGEAILEASHVVGVEAGVTISFEVGANLKADGMIVGRGESANPIRLIPASTNLAPGTDVFVGGAQSDKMRR